MPAVGPLDFARFVAAVAPPDGDALARFVESRDEDAFAELVRRHAALVADVCRCVLRHDADAEDAFQATFLVLARNAARVRSAGSLAAWLHGVALRVSRKARATAARRRDRDQALPPPTLAPDRDELSWAEVRRALHDELAALPVGYREPLMLCYLQGASHDRAAAELSVSKSALKKRLERGREKLRVALTRRGLGPAAVLAVVSLPAACPASMIRAATGGVASARVLSLATGGKSTMILTKWTAAFVTLAVAMSAVLAAGQLTGTGGSPGPRPALKLEESGRDTAESPQHPDGRWIEGEWKVKSITTDGVEVKGDDVKDARVTFKDGKFDPKGRGLNGLALGAFSLDPAQTPKGFDLRFHEGPRKRELVQGIYTFNTDEVRVALRFTRESQGRPKGYYSTAGTGILTLILEPVEKKGPPPRPAPPPVPNAVERNKAVRDAAAIPRPKTTPFAYSRKNAAYLAAFREGYLDVMSDYPVGAPDPSDENLHVIRGWIEGWKAGIAAGGKGDLPAKYAPFIVWRE